MNDKLDALERLYCAGRLDLDYVLSPKHKEDYDLIENALKRLEQLEEEKQSFDRAIEKSLKALEIIKEKGIILQFIKETYTVEQYNAGVFGTLVKPLTQEEYDLLKEIFDE